MSVAICEDEPYMLVELEEKTHRFFEKDPHLYRLACFRSAEQLLSVPDCYDLVLMDIRLPGMDGMEAAELLRKRDPGCAILFISSGREEVFRAFDVDAVHFLVKPLEESLLFRAMEKAIRRLEKRDGGNLVISRGQVIRKIRFDEIICCEAVNHTIFLRLTHERQESYYYRLSDLSRELDGNFYRCHRSYILNLAHVVALENGMACMSNGSCIPVSRRHRKELACRLLTFLRKEILE